MSSRTADLVLSMRNMEVYNQSLAYLDFYRKFIYGCKVGERKRWKTWQSSAILCTNSISLLPKHYLVDKRYQFLLTARFRQDCVENLFSLIRFKQKRPTALQFKDNLKLLIISQFMAEIPSSSYDADDRTWLLDLTEGRDRDITRNHPSKPSIKTCLVSCEKIVLMFNPLFFLIVI